MMSCRTCDGDRFVLVGLRDGCFEEYAVCPDCNSAGDGSFWRVNGTHAVPMEPGAVREIVRRGPLVDDAGVAQLEQLVQQGVAS